MHMYQLLQCTYMAKCDFVNHAASIKRQINKLFVDYTKGDNNYTFLAIFSLHVILFSVQMSDFFLR